MSGEVHIGIVVYFLGEGFPTAGEIIELSPGHWFLNKIFHQTVHAISEMNTMGIFLILITDYYYKQRAMFYLLPTSFKVKDKYCVSK